MNRSQTTLLSEHLEKEREYWLGKLAGELALTELPLDFQRPEVFDGREDRVEIAIDREMFKKLLKASRKNSGLTFSILVAALKIFLHKYTGEHDIIVGSAIHEQHSEDAVLNSVVAVRDRVSGTATARQLLADVKQTLAEAYKYQKYPLGRLLELLDLGPAVNREPLFNAVILLDNIHDPEKVRSLKHDITFRFSLASDELKGLIEYRGSLFTQATVEQFARHYAQVLRSMLDHPDAQIFQLNMLSAVEIEQLLRGFNETASEYPREATIAGLFAEQVEQRGDAVAVVYGNERVTYAELNERANQLGHYLRSLGVDAEQLVGVCIERSVAMVVSLLGVLKAGGAYLPLDAANPRERLQGLIREAGAKVLLIEEQYRELFAGSGAQVVCVDSEWEQSIGRYGRENLQQQGSAEQLAYCMFTSGSTGVPNGVCVTQRSVVRLVKETNFAQFGPEEVFLQMAPLSFDASTLELWGSLLNGGRLVLMPPGVPALEELGAKLRSEEVTTLWLTAGLFHVMVEQRLEDLLGLRQLLAGGDVLAVPQVQKFLERSGGRTKLINGYGPTENTTFTCCHELSLAEVKQTAPIGRPIANTRVYLLNEELEPVPVGVNGQLYIAGDGLARCYLQRPELTAEKFIPNPYGAAGERLYRSGDTARYRSDGVLEFVGRRDNQVKVRGFRIELGEIETVLGSHPQVQVAVVVARRGKDGEQRVLGYVVAAAEITAAELREYLRGKVPEYMVPAELVLLAEMPLTANGKIDRRALPEPEAVGSEREYVAARTEMEELVAGVWQQVLGLERVGVHDSFFDLGGHSLLATQANTRLRDALKVSIPLVLIFETSTLAELAAAIEKEVRAGHGMALPPISRVASNGSVPLSFAQQRLWFLDRLMPEPSSYNTPVTYRISGPLQIGALKKSLDQLVARHEVLRTTIGVVEGEPMQIIAPKLRLKLEVTDLRKLTGAEQEAAVRREVDREAQQPFDLSTGPVMRARLLRLGDEEHVFVVTMHHIVADGWSMGVFTSDLSALYEAACKGEQPALAPLPVQYADYAVWQREWLQGQELERQLGYWREQLAGAPTVLELPADKLRPKLLSGRGAMERFEVSSEVLAGLKSVAREEGATLFMTLLASFSVLLARYAGQKDLLIGAPIANRNREEIEKLIGFFSNTLVLRTRLDDTMSFRELVRQAKETCLGAYAHQDLPFEALVEELQPERDLSRSPLFQVVLTVQNAPMKPLELSGLTLSQIKVHTDTAKFDFGLNVYERNSMLDAGFEYNRDLFELDTIKKLIESFQLLLEGIIENPDQRIDELPVISRERLDYLINDWNDTGEAYPLERSMHSLIEEQAARTPEAVALEWGEQQLSYGELNRRANQLARYLIERGVGPGAQVGILLPHSFDLVTSVLAVLKTGASYVPLEPEHPRLRLQFSLEDARATLVLTEEQLLEKLSGTEVPLVAVDREAGQWAGLESSNLELPVSSESLAYLIYTSGSTGRPKGVKITHRSLVNYVSWAAEQYLGDGARSFALYSSLAFDLTVTSLYAPLVVGGRGVIYEKRGRETAALRVFEEGKVEVVKLTPSHLSLVAGMDHRQSRIRRLVVGGEALETSLARRVWESFGGRVEIINEYGPTEATVGCMIHRYDPEQDQRVQVPIGRPAGNAQIYVVDEGGREVGEGITGELVISGAGVAAGYYNQPELTAARFVENRYRPGTLSYRTGDLARRLSSGVVEYLGRRDGQVKVRGHRVELSELRVAVNAHGEVRDSVVVQRRREVGGTEVAELVCYYVARREVSEEELREWLRERVVEETIPSRFVRIGKIPLTLNGKVNEEALPDPWGQEEEAASSGPRELSETEQVLAGVWQQVLGVQEVKADDNFFSLGGHSLLATLIVIRIHEMFGVEIPLRRIFEKPTIASLAADIDAAKVNEKAETDPDRIPRQSREHPLPLSFAQQRLWFLDRLVPETALYNAPIAYRISGPLQVEALEESLNQLIVRHEVLRTTISLVDGEPMQIIAPELQLKLPVTDLRAYAGAEQEAAMRREIEREAQQPFDLSTGPVLRARVLRLADEEHVFVVTMHHIVADGWSMSVFAKDLSEWYAASSRGDIALLAPLPVQYADYAVWQREWLQGEELERQLGYWREQLAGAPTVLELPADKPRPKMLGSPGTYYRFEVNAEICSRLRELSQQEGATLFMTLLAGFSVLLSRYTGQKDLLIGAPIANRNREEIADLIGFFSNTLVLRERFEEGATFRSTVKQTKEVCLGAYAHQDLPFEKLVEELQPERDLSRSPLFQVIFSLQNAGDVTIELPDLTVKPMLTITDTAKFDLNLILYENGPVLVGGFEYNCDLFEAETIERMKERFLVLLENLVTNPDQEVTDAPMLRSADESQFAVTWNETEAAYPLERSMHSLIEEQVARTPEAVALEWGEQQLSYGELNQRANQLARYLVKRGVGPGAQVGILLPHSFALVTSVLAVLKSGASYVPLEPEHPRLRLRFSLEDARATLVLTEERLLDKLSGMEVPLVAVDREAGQWAGLESSNLELPVSSESLAYLIYTSGSTGRPKGVKITHRSLVNYVSWAAEQYLGDGARSFALYSSLAFDLTVTSLYAPLVVGGRGVIYEKRGRETAALRVFEEGKVEVVKLTPSHLSLVAGMDHRQSRIRRLVVGGEALETSLARRVWESFGGRVEIINEYGPTEATVGCMIHRYDPEQDQRVQVPIGRPAANAQIYVVDEGGREVGEGLTGELVISGAGVAAGYYNQRELTAARFVENRYRPGTLSYRTGDLARRLSSGVVEYLGRRDGQVKVRGHRVELSELRVAVNAHAEVRDSVVVQRRREVIGAEVAELVCYYVARREVSEEELREWLRERVVEETIPSRFVRIGKIPLTLNGKVNEEALPDPWPTEEEESGAHEPRELSETEQVLAGVWQQVLGVREVKADDNFFSLGGHSLLATLIVIRIHEAFGVEIPLRKIFEKPTIALLAADIEAAKVDEEAEADPDRIPRQSREHPLPLSFAQQRLWFLDRLLPEAALYNVPIAHRISGPLQVEVLEESLNQLIVRHEVLRTTIDVIDGEPVQIIAPELRLKLPVTDLRAYAGAEQKAALRREVEREAKQPFDLSTGPVMRARLFRLADEEHLFVVTMHHIVADGWSMAVFASDLSALYAASSKGDKPVLAPLPVQYADYAVWQREWLQDEELERQLGYWREQLAGAPTVLELPADKPRPKMLGSPGAFYTFELNAELCSRLRDLSQQEGATLFMTLLAGFSVLVSRYTGQKDLLIGAPIANRNREEIAGLIGFFANTLVLRERFEEGATFRSIIKQTKEVCLGAYAHQDLPFEKLVEELLPERDLTRSPLFQVLFALQNAPQEALRLEGLSLSPVRVETEIAKFDLSLLIIDTAQGLQGVVEYSTDLFERETIERLLGHFRILLEAIVAEPQRAITELPLLSAAERQQLLVEWNGTKAEERLGSCIHQLFEEQVEKTPEATALVFANERLSYAELNRRANQLAHYLREQGVGREVRVGVMLERSVEMVVSLLAVLKAGGAYVPLDSEYPAERLAFMIEDAQLPVLLTTDRFSKVMPPTEAKVIRLDGQSEQLTAANSENLTIDTQPDELAYVMYTSGSTGIPKGVSVPHRAVIRLVKETDFVRFAADEVFLQLAPVSFDASTLELWGSLLNGAQLVLMPPQTPSLEELGAALRHYGVTTLWLTAGLFHLMVDERLEDLSGVRQLLAGGDVLSTAHVQRFLAAAGNGVLINGYGPTENTTFSCTHRMAAGWELKGSSVPIGRPIKNTQVYVLDERLEPAPVGVAGELYLGGAGLAREYLRRPELTAEKFVPHPYSVEPGARLYRTGDLVRWLATGEIEFLGRIDQQVKIRGFRIELEEIAAALKDVAEVNEAVVIVREDTPGEKQLVAYVVPQDGNLTINDLRAHLKRRLPEYMVPSIFIYLDELPLTPNGKVDRKALPAPETDFSSASGYVAPRTPVEEMLCGIWSEVLEVTPIGLTDNFFWSGGHSLRATVIVIRIHETFGVEIPLRTIFEAPTVPELAAVIEAAIEAERGYTAPPITPVERRGPLPLSFAQQRLWFLDRLNPETDAYNIAIAYHLKGSLNAAVLEQSLNQLVARHEVLRTTISLVDGEPVQIIAPEVELKLEVADLQALVGLQQEMAVAEELEREAQRVFDLSTGPILRARLLRLSEEAYVFVVTMHHIASDGWSMDVFSRELSLLYDAEVNGTTAALPELSVQYADYAVWQGEWLKGEILEEQLSYWREQLHNANAVLELPADKKRPRVAAGVSEIERFEIDSEVLAGLRNLSLEEGTTLFMTLWTAFSVLLSRYTGQQDLLIGTPVANRERPEVAGLIGLFTNTLVLRARVPGNESFRSLLAQAREICLGAYSHQELPFETLVEALQPNRDVSRSPLVQVLFAVQSGAIGALELTGMEASPFPVAPRTTKFELNVVLGEREGRLAGAIQYNTELFEAGTIAQLASHLATLLEHVLENPDRPVSELPLLTPAETETALVQWNQTVAEYPAGRCAHQLFEMQVERIPDSVALISRDRQITYSELNRDAGQLARYLSTRGVGPETNVAVCLEPSVESAIGILGVLKAGGVCLLLDPLADHDQLSGALAEARPHLLLVQGRLLEDSLQWRERLVRIDSQWEEIARAGQWTNDSAVLPENLAYLSCERSKDGEVRLVGHTHQALVNGLHWMQRALRLSELDHVLPEFGLWELLLPLSCGSAAFVAEAGQQHASVVQCSPSLLENLLDEPRNLSGIKHVICSGEPLLPDLVERFAKRLPTADLHHLHGSGELSAGAGYWTLNSGDDNPLIPAIRPITNTQLYVLDESMQPVPVGVEGTLYAGGINLARGYQNRSDLTAETFVPDPFSGQPGSRLFKTNERCKYQRDGAIVPLGPQVRSRGYQVNLLDVERELRQCPLISRAAVVAVEQPHRDQQLIAYVVPAGGQAAHDLIPEVRAFMRERLPDYALPSAYLSLAALPLRHDGTLDRDALPLSETELPETTSAFAPSTETEQKIAELWREYLAVEHLGLNDNFFDLGGHSLLLAQLHPRLNELCQTDVTVIDLFRYSTVRTLAEYIDKRAVRTTVVATRDEVPGELLEVPEVTTPVSVAADVPANAIAIIGMAARFPGCRDVEEFWQKLKDGEELISSFSDDELLAAGVSKEWLQDPNYVKAAAFLEQADYFDAQFFGIQPREAEVMDPQQRVFLECAWSALETAGIDAERYRGRVGVYAGVGHNTYLPNVFGNAEVMRSAGGFQVILANDKDFLPMRVSYKLNLRGPSITVQTACSTSLVAVHLALQALLNDECDVALCGGVTLRAAKSGYLYQEGSIVSPDGHCRSFDAEAAGTVPGNGAGVVVLKRLRDALADRDSIDAVIIGSAINNDGSHKVGFTAPSIDGQADVIERAQINAGVTPDTITYIEAHGTGTELGDPIEVAALNQAFRTATQKKAYCALGSVKSNLGHLDAAAGVGGLIKTVLALKHKELPPSLHYQTANPKIDFANSPFYVNNKLTKWETNGLPRRAGVSSFGMGGTNAHLVVQEAPETTAPIAVDEPQLILLTAKTPTALETATTNLVQHLEQHPELNLRDVAYTLQAGRQHFGHRRMVVAHDRNDVIETLGRLDGKRVGTSHVDQRERPCVFVFPGQGSQYVNMGAGLYESAPTFRRHVDECCELLKRYTGTDLREQLYPRSGDPADAARWFDQTVNAQPALFVIEYALTQFLAELGVKPKAMLGHSVGEYVAACVAGVFSLETALLLVARRAELMQSLPVGRMLFVPLPEREIESLLNEETSLAAVNGVDFCVVSGTPSAVEKLDRELTERDIECQPLHTSHAFHSAMVEPIIKPFVEFVKKVEIKPPRIPFVSNVTGAWITVSQAVDPNYWGDHVRRTVRFSDGLKSLLTDPRTLVLEVGPGTTLSGLIRKHPSHTPEQKVLASMRHPKDTREDFEVFLQALGEAWLARQQVDWPALHADKEPRKIALPTYPFERKRYWIDPPTTVAAQVASVSAEVVAEVVTRPNGDGAEPVAKPLAMSATAQQAIVPSSAVVEPQIVTRVERPANGDGNGTTPAPKHQIIAQQLKISSEQIKLMALQLEVLRNARRPKAP